jgi:hypothetical protein
MIFSLATSREERWIGPGVGLGLREKPEREKERGCGLLVFEGIQTETWLNFDHRGSPKNSKS